MTGYRTVHTRTRFPHNACDNRAADQQLAARQMTGERESRNAIQDKKALNVAAPFGQERLRQA